MNSFKSLLSNQSLLPIIQANSVQEGIQIADAMKKGGVHLVEVVLRTDSSLEALSAIKQAFPEMVVGAGTVLSSALLDKALSAGADFVVTPAVSSSLLTALKDANVPALPGVSNTADILMAQEHGFPELKLFPASLCGGMAFLKAVGSVFRDVEFCPTGGVNAENYQDYLYLNNCFAVGGTWVANRSWIDDNQWDRVTEACLQANSTVAHLPSKQ